MPTALQRTTVTHVPRAKRVLDAGHQLFPGRADGEVLIELAERALTTTTTRGVAGLTALPGPERTITAAEIDEALLDD